MEYAISEHETEVEVSPIHGTHQGSVGGRQVHLLVQHWKKSGEVSGL